MSDYFLKCSVCAIVALAAGTAGVSVAQIVEDDTAHEELEQCRAIINPPCACDNSCPLREIDETAAMTVIDPIDLQDLRVDPVYVWGDRTRGEPGSVSALYSGTIGDVAADRPAEILNRAPGVNIQMNSGQEHLISIRSPVLTGGAGQGSFLILENGVPTRSPAFGNVNSLIEPHLEIADAIEIVRGPGSARYGSNAVHGLINVILPEPDSAQFAQASYGSLGKWRGDAAAELGGVRLGFSIQDDTGWRNFTGSDQQKFSAQGKFDAGAWTLQPWISASNLAQETAGFIEGPRAFEDEDKARRNPNPEAFRDAWSWRAAMRAEREIGDRTLTLTPFLRSQAMIFSQHFLPYGGVEKNAHTGGGLMAQLDGGQDILSWRLGADLDLATGYLKEIQPLPNANPAFVQGQHYDYAVETRTGALWGEVALEFGHDVELLAGLRAETHEYDYDTRLAPGIRGRFNVPADRSNRFDLLTPKLGLIWHTEPGAFYVNYARGERAPQVSDLYRLQNLQRPGEIRTETLDSIEFGYRGTLFDDLHIDAAVYTMEKENFFFRDSDGLNVTNGSTQHRGAEIAGYWELSDALSLNGNLAWSDQTYTFNRPVRAGAEIIRDGAQIDTAPEWLADISVHWTLREGLDFELSTEHLGEYFTNPANTAVYPGHTVLNARAAWQINAADEVFLIVRNLTDERYADRADFAFGVDRYFPGEPLNATIGFRKKFN